MNHYAHSAVGQDHAFVLFQVAQMRCAVEIRWVQEINRKMDITPVLTAPEYVQGVINLRGQIVTLIDLKRKLGIEALQRPGRANIIVRCDGESIGLLVDDVEDILHITMAKILSPPAHISGPFGQLLVGVVQMADDLVGILDVEKLISP